MPIFLRWGALALLAACAAPTAPLEVDEVGAARAAESPPDLLAVAQALDARRGERLSDNLTILGASAEGRRLVMSFRDTRDLRPLGPAAREIYAMDADRQIRTQICAQPATRTFVEEYDGVVASIEFDRRRVACRRGDHCMLT